MCDCNCLAESFRSPPALRSEETSSIESLGVGVDDDRGTMLGAPGKLGRASVPLLVVSCGAADLVFPVILACLLTQPDHA